MIEVKPVEAYCEIAKTPVSALMTTMTKDIMNVGEF
jgi:hypothetical protein